MTKRTLILCALAVSSSDIALAQAAPASSQAADTADIIVTATRREQRLQDVPLAVTALSADTLRTRGISSAADLGTGKVPGLAINSLQGSEVSIALNMRGYGTSDASQGTQDMAVAFYIDGINLPRAQGMALDLITPERIEVLRGPQGQLFGRNAEAGAIQIVSRKPSGRFSSDLTAGFGNFGQRMIKGSVDLPEIAGFKVQISGVYRKHQGYVKNVKNPLLEGVTPYTNPNSSFHFKQGDYDQDFNQLDTHGIRAAVARDFGALNFFYTYDNSWSKDDQGFTFFANSTADGTIFNPGGGTGPARIFTTFGGIFQQQPLDYDHYPKSAPYSLMYTPFITKSNGHMLNLTFDASDQLTLKSITGVRESLRYGGAALSIALSSVQPSATEYLRSRTFSQEFQAIVNLKNFNLTAGAIYFHEADKDERDAGFTTNCPAGIPGAACTPTVNQPSRPPDVNPLLPAGVNNFTRQFSKTEAYAAYGQASWTPEILDERLEFTGGLRYSHDTKTGRRTISGGNLLATPIVNRAKTDRVDPAAMVKFKWSPTINTYFRYASGFRDGGANVRSLVFNAYLPEKLDSLEIGLKSQLFDRRLTFNVAAFHNTVSNQQQSLQSNPAINPSVSDTFNVPSKYKTNGFELETNLHLVPGLTLSGNYTYLHSNLRFVGIDTATLTTFRLTNPTFAANGGLIPSAADIAAHPNSSMLQLYPLGAPKHSGSISIDYSMPVFSGPKLAVHAEWVRSSAMVVASPVRLFTVVSNGVATPKPYYVGSSSSNRVNGRVSLMDLSLSGGVKGELTFWVKNLLNHVDAAHIFGAGNALNATTPRPQTAIYLQPPRTLGGEFRIHF